MSEVDYFPAFLKLENRPCLVVGGGEVAARKARLLLDAGAGLTVVAPELCPALVALRSSGRIAHIARRFRRSDVAGHWLVVTATGIAAVDRQVEAAATAAGRFCNAVDDPAHCTFITPAIIDRSPVVVAVSSGGAAPVLARRIRARIEALLPDGLGRVAVLARDWRERVQARLGDLASRRRFWERVIDGRPARLAGNGDLGAAAAAMAAMLEDVDDDGDANPTGVAWLVGAGPGDPDLLTLAALQCLEAADVVLYDRLVSDGVLARARRDAELIAVGKLPGGPCHRQQDINALLVELVAAGKRVCRLKGGDPFVFGRGGEEAAALAEAGLDYRVVPGITAASGCAAAAGIPLTHRDAAQSVVLLTAHGKDSVDRLDWPSLARDRQTLAVYMAVGRFAELRDRLVANGRSADTPVAIIERGTTPQQRIVHGTLGQLTMLAAAHRIGSPAMLIVGEVARLGALYGAPAAARQTLPAGDPGAVAPVSAIQPGSAIQRVAKQR